MRQPAKWYVLLLSNVLILHGLYAQSSELGFGIGTLTYTGDLVRNYDFKYSKPAATVFYRANVSTVVSFRAGITAGKIGASEKPIDALGVERKASFDLFLFEGSTVMEYHFLNWRDSKKFVRFTPYMFAGFGIFGISGNEQKTAEYSNIQAAIPFGAGIKYVYDPRWYFSLEFGARKTFFDYLDNVSEGNQHRKNFQYGNPNDNDHYFFLGISITRTFYDIPCPKNPYK